MKLLTLALLCSALTVHANAFAAPKPKKATSAIVDGISYKLDAKNQRAKITAGTNLYAGSVTIPEKFEDDSVVYYVEEIEGGAFRDCVTLTDITIPSTVMKIGAEAFKNCTSLEDITIPTSVTELRASTFEGCSSLQSVVMHNSLTSLGASLFRRCTALQTISIPDGVKSLPANIFFGCSSLRGVAIPSTVSNGDSLPFVGPEPHSVIPLTTPVALVGRGQNV